MFPLIKLAKKLKDDNGRAKLFLIGKFPLIKLAKKLKVVFLAAIALAIAVVSIN